MLALIIVVCLVAISSLGSNANTTFSNVAASIGGAS
jgi:Flp pilus assembly pilin Flp